MPMKPEAKLQTKIKKWAKEFLPPGSLFLGLDLARKASDYSRISDAIRGVTGGTPDTVVLIPNYRSIWVELKWKGNKPSERQVFRMEEIRRAGHLADWCNTVEGFAGILASNFVPISNYGREVAAAYDRELIESVQRDKEAGPKVSKTRFDKPTGAKVRAGQRKRTALQNKGIFL